MTLKVIVFSSILAFARAGLSGQEVSTYSTGPVVAAPASISKSFVQTYTNHRQPVSYASPLVLQAYSAPLAFSAPQHSFVPAYSSPITSQVVSPYSAPLNYLTPLASQIISPYSAPLGHLASQSAYVSAYSGPGLAARSVTPLRYAAHAPVLSAYSSPIVAKSFSSIGYAAHTPFVSAYPSPIVSRTYAAGPLISSPVLSSPLVSRYSAAPVVQPW